MNSYNIFFISTTLSMKIGTHEIGYVIQYRLISAFNMAKKFEHARTFDSIISEKIPK